MLMLLIIGIATYAIKVDNEIKKVSKIYGEQKPRIVQINTSTEETTNKIMIIIFLKGNFQDGNQKSKNLEFSMTIDCKKVWALRFDSWVDNEVNVSN